MDYSYKTKVLLKVFKKISNTIKLKKKLKSCVKSALSNMSIHALKQAINVRK